MGNCVTVYKNNQDPAAMNLSAQIQSPAKENFVRMEDSVTELSSRPRGPQQPSSVEQESSFRHLSKTENFFDSQPWLESDCEDFLSANGDATSSCGNSPTHQKSFREGSLHDKNNSMDRAHGEGKKQKQLIELFRESFNDDSSLKGQLEDKPKNFNLPPNSTSRGPYESIPISFHSSETEATPYKGMGYLPKKGKSTQSAAQCCLPNLVRNRSFGERKKRLSPGKTDGS